MSANFHCRMHTWTRQALASTAVLLGVLLGGASSASAVPGIKDMWHFFCAPPKISSKLIASARSKAGDGSGTQAAIAMLNYACLLEVYEEDQLIARLNKWQAGGGKGAQPQIDRRTSSAALKNAAQSLAGAYRANKNNPTVLYWHGMALAIQGDVMAVNVIDELQTQHGSNKLAGDSYLILAEHYFERRDLAKATREYDEALKRASATVKDYTKYKKTWIKFAVALDAKNVSQQRAAIQELLELKSRLGKKGRPAKLASIIEKDITDILVAQGDMAEAKRVLTAMKATDTYAALLERMANTKLQTGDITAASQYFHMALKEGPNRLEAFDISTTLIAIAAQRNDTKRVADLVRFVIATYVEPKSKWRAANKKNAKELAEITAKVEAMTIDYALAIDEQGRQAQNLAVLGQAAALYEQFLKTFPKSKKIQDVRAQLGQVFYLQKQFAKAASTLAEVLKANPRMPNAKDTADIMLTAAQTAVDADKTQYPPVDLRQITESPIPPVRKTYADCLDTYVTTIAANPNAAAMQFAAASVYYDFAHFDEAMKRFDAFLTRHPQSEFTGNVALKMLTYYDVTNDAPKLEKAMQKVQTLPQIAAAADIAPLLAKAKVKINKAKKDGSYAKAAKAAKKDSQKKAASDEDEDSDDEEADDEADTEKEPPKKSGRNQAKDNKKNKKNKKKAADDESDEE